VAWVLRTHPVADHSGQSSWLRSLLRAAASAGCHNTLLVPNGTGLPLRCERRHAIGVTESPHLRLLGETRAVGDLGVVSRQLAWSAYLHLPKRAQAGVATARRAIRHRAGVDHRLGTELSSNERRWVETRLRLAAPEVVVFDGVFDITASPPGTRRVLIAADVLHERARAIRDAGYRPEPDVTARWESERLGAVDDIIAIQWDDAETLARLAPTARVVVAPPLLRRTPPPSAVTANHRCLLVGSGTLHNVDGARWMLDQIWPLIRSQVPDARLDVVGTLGSQLGGVPDGVDIAGEVDDLDAWYDAAQVVVVPLRYGSGLKVKLVEALCRSRPVVTTPAGIQGLAKMSPRGYLVAESPAQFAAAVTQLLREPRSCLDLCRSAHQLARLFDVDAGASCGLLDVLGVPGGI